MFSMWCPYLVHKVDTVAVTFFFFFGFNATQCGPIYQFCFVESYKNFKNHCTHCSKYCMISAWSFCGKSEWIGLLWHLQKNSSYQGDCRLSSHISLKFIISSYRIIPNNDKLYLWCNCCRWSESHDKR